jgi:uncharacterized membrane protein YgaE (UPF0421/DUF939 family)
MNFIGYRTLKTVIGAVVSIYLAMALGLKYATAAGIITILSLQSTRRQSLRLTSKMIGAFLLALLLAVVLFKLFGYTPLIFGLFLLLFIPISVRLKVQEGIVVSAVLITQLLIEKTTEIPFILNQISLMALGVVIALFLNLYMPSFESKIKEEQDIIEKTIKKILLDMSNALLEQVVSIEEEELFNHLEIRLKQGREMAHKNFNNSFSSNNSDYITYMDIRFQQLHCLQKMRKHFERLSITYKQTILIADFTVKIAHSIQCNDAAEKRLVNLSKLRKSFTTMELPQNREEFENRGILYQFLNDMEEFLQLEVILE